MGTQEVCPLAKLHNFRRFLRGQMVYYYQSYKYCVCRSNSYRFWASSSRNNIKCHFSVRGTRDGQALTPSLHSTRRAVSGWGEESTAASSTLHCQHLAPESQRLHWEEGTLDLTPTTNKAAISTNRQRTARCVVQSASISCTACLRENRLSWRQNFQQHRNMSIIYLKWYQATQPKKQKTAKGKKACTLDSYTILMYMGRG